MSEQQECHEVRPSLAELATGAVSGDDRARALAHVTGCAACRQELAELARAADAVLLLAPPVDPPPGFESGVLARLRADAGAASARGRSGRPWVAAIRRRLPRAPWLRPAVAFGVAVVLAAGGGVQAAQWRSADDRRLAEHYRETLAVADGRYLKALRMTTVDGQSAGTVFLYQGNPSWLLVTISSAPADGAYEVLAVDRNGAVHPSGTCQVYDRRGTAGYHLDIPVAAVTRVQLRSATATLSTVG
jgi:hypothetical protein